MRTIVTGASGLLGSATVLSLLKHGHQVVAVDNREPSPALLQHTVEVQWIIGDFAACQVLARLQEVAVDEHPLQIVHLAAHYDFGTTWHDRYQQSNVAGLKKLLDWAITHGVQRFVFASSLAVHGTIAEGEVLTEETMANATMPYGRSKIIGEEILQAQTAIPVTILRIGGVFTEQCELPPLFGLLNLWQGRWPLRRCVVGQGLTAIPYIHRQDFADLLVAVCRPGRHAAEYEVLLACGHEATNHLQLFQAVHQGAPRHLPTWCAAVGLRLQLLLAWVTGHKPIERPWMLTYVDRPLNIDNSFTRQATGWCCDPNRHILMMMPILLDRMRAAPVVWRQCNERRNSAQYVWEKS